jgi:Flp pilus assembly pilin Flp
MRRFLEMTLRKVRRAKGQTMTEYALILATVAIVLSSLYTTAGLDVETLVGKVGSLF